MLRTSKGTLPRKSDSTTQQDLGIHRLRRTRGAHQRDCPRRALSQCALETGGSIHLRDKRNNHRLLRGRKRGTFSLLPPDHWSAEHRCCSCLTTGTSHRQMRLPSTGVARERRVCNGPRLNCSGNLMRVATTSNRWRLSVILEPHANIRKPLKAALYKSPSLLDRSGCGVFHRLVVRALDWVRKESCAREANRDQAAR